VQVGEGYVVLDQFHDEVGLAGVQYLPADPTITLTSDTYTSLLPELDRENAEKAAKLIPRSRPTAADSSAQAAPDPQATSTSTHASLTEWLENEAAPDPTEVESGAA
jgi:hypothetical protein